MEKQKSTNFKRCPGEICMKTAHILKKAQLSEKAYAQMEKGIYTFLIDRRASKDQIKKAVEAQFATKVVKVNVLNKLGKSKRASARSRKQIMTGMGRKALVFLAPGQKIEMLSPKREAVKKMTKNSKEAKEETKPKEEGLLSKIRKSKPEGLEGK